MPGGPSFVVLARDELRSLKISDKTAPKNRSGDADVAEEQAERKSNCSSNLSQQPGEQFAEQIEELLPDFFEQAGNEVLGADNVAEAVE